LSGICGIFGKKRKTWSNLSFNRKQIGNAGKSREIITVFTVVKKAELEKLDMLKIVRVGFNKVDFSAFFRQKAKPEKT